MDQVIECRKIDAAYQQSDGSERHVLKGIDVWFPAGRMTLISGIIGAGKSTLLHILAGIQRPTAGEVIVNGEAVSRWIGADRERWRRQVGIVFQVLHLINDLTVLENVLLPLIPDGISLSECRIRGLETLQLLEIDHLAESPTSTLSGGERQKVAVARAMVNRPAFIFADEPTAHQDARNAEQVLRILESALDWGAVVVIASHDSEIHRFISKENHYMLKDGILSNATPGMSTQTLSHIHRRTRDYTERSSVQHPAEPVNSRLQYDGSSYTRRKGRGRRGNTHRILQPSVFNLDT